MERQEEKGTEMQVTGVKTVCYICGNVVRDGYLIDGKASHGAHSCCLLMYYGDLYLESLKGERDETRAKVEADHGEVPAYRVGQVDGERPEGGAGMIDFIGRMAAASAFGVVALVVGLVTLPFLVPMMFKAIVKRLFNFGGHF